MLIEDMRIGLIYSGVFAIALAATWWLRQPDQVVQEVTSQLALVAAPSPPSSHIVATAHDAATRVEDARDEIPGDTDRVVSAIAADTTSVESPPRAQPPATVPINRPAVAPPGDELRDQIAGDIYPTVAN